MLIRINCFQLAELSLSNQASTTCVCRLNLLQLHAAVVSLSLHKLGLGLHLSYFLRLLNARVDCYVRYGVLTGRGNRLVLPLVQVLIPIGIHHHLLYGEGWFVPNLIATFTVGYTILLVLRYCLTCRVLNLHLLGVGSAIDSHGAIDDSHDFCNVCSDLLVFIPQTAFAADSGK